jgi:hypothetical protein
MWHRGYGFGGYGVCDYEPITNEEKIALLERKEKRLEQVIEHIRKVKESIKSGKPMEEENDSEE